MFSPKPPSISPTENHARSSWHLGTNDVSHRARRGPARGGAISFDRPRSNGATTRHLSRASCSSSLRRRSASGRANRAQSSASASVFELPSSLWRSIVASASEPQYAGRATRAYRRTAVLRVGRRPTSVGRAIIGATPTDRGSRDDRQADLDRQRVPQLQLPDRLRRNRRGARRRSARSREMPRRREERGLDDHASPQHARAPRPHRRKRGDGQENRRQGPRARERPRQDRRHRPRARARATSSR